MTSSSAQSAELTTNPVAWGVIGKRRRAGVSTFATSQRGIFIAPAISPSTLICPDNATNGQPAWIYQIALGSPGMCQMKVKRMTPKPDSRDVTTNRFSGTPRIEARISKKSVSNDRLEKGDHRVHAHAIAMFRIAPSRKKISMARASRFKRHVFHEKNMKTMRS